MRAPSVKTLLQITTEEKAKEIRELLQKKRKTTDYASVREWESKCYHRPSYCARLMCALNEIIGGYGLEIITKRGGVPVFEFINMGDPYTATIILNLHKQSFHVACWGDIVEKGNYE